MDLLVAKILLNNLLSRVEIQDNGSGTLTGRLTVDELAALRMAAELVGGTPIAVVPRTTVGPTSAESQPTSALAEEVDRNDADGVSEEIPATEALHVKLDFGALGSQEMSQDARVCLDFGTAMSKATLVVDGSGTEPEHIRVLPLGIPGNQEEISETMLISSVYIDNKGTLRFGKAAVDHSMPEGADGSRGRLDNIKRRLSEEGWDEQVNERFNPTDLSVSYGDMVLAYLSFLTWTINRCLVDLGYPHNMPRRFAVPCFPGEKRREVVHSVRPKTGDLATTRRGSRVFSRRILHRIGIFSEKSSPSRAEMAAWGDVGELHTTPTRPTSRVGFQIWNRPRLSGRQTSSAAPTRLASQTFSFSSLQ